MMTNKISRWPCLCTGQPDQPAQPAKYLNHKKASRNIKQSNPLPFQWQTPLWRILQQSWWRLWPLPGWPGNPLDVPFWGCLAIARCSQLTWGLWQFQQASCLLLSPWPERLDPSDNRKGVARQRERVTKKINRAFLANYLALPQPSDQRETQASQTLPN